MGYFEEISSVTAGIDATLLEVVVHTKRIQNQTIALASICKCQIGQRSQESSQGIQNGDENDKQLDQAIDIPEGPELLDSLYRELLEADNFMGPLIR